MHPWQEFSDADRVEYWATLALKYTKGIGPRSITRLLNYFGSAYTALENTSFWQDAKVAADKARLVKTDAWREGATIEWRAAQRCSGRILLWKDTFYPKLLRSLIDAPSILYYRGDLSLCSAPCFAIVGSRQCSSEGVQVAGSIARELSKAGISIVSGMAQGIDRVAHVAALSQVGRSIGVLGTGIDYIYPTSNEDVYKNLVEHGLLFSEFSPRTEPVGSNFPIRNRIVSGLCLGVLVVEGMRNSGSLITARLALEQNREVYAIPGPATASISQGCQELIRQGAKAVFNSEDILYDLAPLLQNHISSNERQVDLVTLSNNSIINQNTSFTTVDQNTIDEYVSNVNIESFSPEEQEEMKNIIKVLHTEGLCHIDTLCMRLDKPVSHVQAILIEMELLQMISKEHGGNYKALCAG